jgi:hypothetical protein
MTTRNTFLRLCCPPGPNAVRWTARVGPAEVGRELCTHLQGLGIRVWFDEVVIEPGASQALQMDRGLAKAHCGIALLTPAYLAGRFWTERELGALLSKKTLIPVLDGVDFGQVREYSGILPYDTAFMGYIRGAYVCTTPWNHPWVSPIEGDLADYPLAVVTAGTHDPLVDSAGRSRGGCARPAAEPSTTFLPAYRTGTTFSPVSTPRKTWCTT